MAAAGSLSGRRTTSPEGIWLGPRPIADRGRRRVPFAPAVAAVLIRMFLLPAMYLAAQPIARLPRPGLVGSQNGVCLPTIFPDDDDRTVSNCKSGTNQFWYFLRER